MMKVIRKDFAKLYNFFYFYVSGAFILALDTFTAKI